MAAPSLPHFVRGTLTDRLGNILASIDVTLTHGTSPKLTKTTGADGKFLFNLGDLDSAWTVGQNITLASTIAAKGTKSLTVAISSGPDQTNDIQLAETSDLVFEPFTQNRHPLHFSLLTSFDGEKITNSNPLPVTTSELSLLNEPSTEWTITRGDGQPDSETVTLASGEKHKRTYTYDSNQFLKTRSEWEKQ